MGRQPALDHDQETRLGHPLEPLSSDTTHPDVAATNSPRRGGGSENYGNPLRGASPFPPPKLPQCILGSRVQSRHSSKTHAFPTHFPSLWGCAYYCRGRRLLRQRSALRSHQDDGSRFGKRRQLLPGSREELPTQLPRGASLRRQRPRVLRSVNSPPPSPGAR